MRSPAATLVLLCTAMLYTATPTHAGFFDTFFDSRTKATDGILLQSVQSLVFKPDQYTTGRRNKPIAQMHCLAKDKVGKQLCEQHQPNSIMCRNVGFDGSDVNWKCEADLPTGVKLGNVDVVCEGYDSPNDPYILKGSCGVEYALTGKPVERPVEQIVYQQPHVYDSAPKTTVLEPTADLYAQYDQTKQKAKSYVSSLMDTVLPSSVNTLLGRKPAYKPSVTQSWTNSAMNTVFGATIGSTLYNTVFGKTAAPSVTERIVRATNPTPSTYDDSDTMISTLLTYLLIAVITYSIYKAFVSSSAGNAAGGAPSSRRRGGGAARGFRMGDAGNNDADDRHDPRDAPRDAPPSYDASANHPTTDDVADKRRRSTRTNARTQQADAATSSTSGTTGFLGGAALGAGLGYMFGNRGNNQSATQTQPRAVYTDPATHTRTYTAPPTQAAPVVVTRSAAVPETTTSTSFATTKRR